jgi:hypothetical protein
MGYHFVSSNILKYVDSFLVHSSSSRDNGRGRAGGGGGGRKNETKNIEKKNKKE